MKAAFLTFLLFLLTVQLYAQAAGNYVQYSNFDPGQSARYQSVAKSARIVADNVLELRINALYNKKADAYIAIFNVIQLGRTAEEANTLLNARMENVLRDIRQLGIPQEDIIVDLVNFLPKYELDASKKLFSKKSYTEIPKGFELQKNLHIRYRDPAMLDRILTATARQEIYDLVKVDYFDSQPTGAYKELRQRAFSYLEEVKEAYAKAGFPLDSAAAITAENTWVAFPGNRYESYQAYSTQSFDTPEKGVAVSAVDKPVSRFYNAVPSNDYDIVINPEVLEPAIQYSFNLIVRFSFLQNAAAPDKTYFILTPNGELREMKF